jgi:hypothetical protein
LLMICALAQAGGSGCGRSQSKVEQDASSGQPSHELHLVSLIQLIARGKDFEGHRVEACGFLSLDEEGAALYVGRDDYENSLAGNSVALKFDVCRRTSVSWSLLDVRDARLADHSYTCIEGLFEAGPAGHGGSREGCICAIREINSDQMKLGSLHRERLRSLESQDSGEAR